MRDVSAGLRRRSRWALVGALVPCLALAAPVGWPSLGATPGLEVGSWTPRLDVFGGGRAWFDIQRQGDGLGAWFAEAQARVAFTAQGTWFEPSLGGGLEFVWVGIGARVGPSLGGAKPGLTTGLRVTFFSGLGLEGSVRVLDGPAVVSLGLVLDVLVVVGRLALQFYRND